MPFLTAIMQVLKELPAGLLHECKRESDAIEGSVAKGEGFFSEEERSKQPSIFSLVRALVQLFSSDEDAHLGLYGAFGYDLAFQFEDIKLHQKRDPEQRDLVLYIPDELLVINHQTQQSWRVRYEFVFKDAGGMCITKGLEGGGPECAFQARSEMPPGVSKRELEKGEFAKLVDVAK